jgi:hypothetical protein
VSISVVKCSWVKCGEVYRRVAVQWCSFVYMVVHGCMFGMLLLISVGYYCYSCVFVLLCYVSSVLLLLLTLTEVFPCFFLSCKANARV